MYTSLVSVISCLSSFVTCPFFLTNTFVSFLYFINIPSRIGAKRENLKFFQQFATWRYTFESVFDSENKPRFVDSVFNHLKNINFL